MASREHRCVGEGIQLPESLLREEGKGTRAGGCAARITCLFLCLVCGIQTELCMSVALDFFLVSDIQSELHCDVLN